MLFQTLKKKESKGEILEDISVSIFKLVRRILFGLVTYLLHESSDGPSD